ncbi:FAD-binding oxidoreductase [Paenibacillus methanolicus]|uniref:FAD/FMN-containing dehydrogenase n=1 Tax=Paenibacillus methanolicus TaxID=582686 RepID=A0A5S5CGG6_9BACL|nr:FAD-binding oxidoreductase [Paenibacillus methanolicus]TYP78889.1 FAD/FMN-containing dehydrogenase [Paenibacillus methanolicus]
MKKTFALALLAALCLHTYARFQSPDQDPYLITDYSRLHPVKVSRVVAGKEEEQLRNLVREARDKGLTISIAGQRHSQGGHTYYKDGVVLDMTAFNHVLDFDPVRRTIRVQAGATWGDVQDYINPHGLSVKTMQSQNIFSIGGSLSVNAHGRDIRNGSLIASVESFRLMNAQGETIQVSRTENAALFPLVIGGYGLFGIIVDVTLRLTDDELYRTRTDTMDVYAYHSYFEREVLGNPDVRMHLARISVAPDRFLTDMYAINYVREDSVPLQAHNRLRERESGVLPAKIMFGISRKSDWGKDALWTMQKALFEREKGQLISRNNAMRSESAFMDYQSATDHDLLQEYFIPVDRFAGFIDDFRSVLARERLNLLNITVRYVNRDEEAALSYATDDMFALVCLFNVPLSEEGQAHTKQAIQSVIDRVLAHKGTYYLPYAAYPSAAQFHAAYPGAAAFFRAKEQADPAARFVNYFYEDYGKDARR